MVISTLSSLVSQQLSRSFTDQTAKKTSFATGSMGFVIAKYEICRALVDGSILRISHGVDVSQAYQDEGAV